MNKPANEVVACVCDYGTFQGLAAHLGKTFAKVYYHTPIETEYRNINNCAVGAGMTGAELLYHPLDRYEDIDLWIFPDIGFAGLQRFLRRQGKAVWGHMGADEYELFRTRFLKLLKRLGLAVPPTKTLYGVSELDSYLRSSEGVKWVKVNQYRDNMETWRHDNYDASRLDLDRLRSEFGGLQEQIVFVVQDDIETEVEIGYDGWTVDGNYPVRGFQGYEKKNQLYLGVCQDYADLPDQVIDVNAAFAELFAELQYRCFCSWEARVAKDGTVYCIDPTFRMPGQTGEQLLCTCDNLPDVIWHGANGELIEPDFNCKYAAEATIHHHGENDWKMLQAPASDAFSFYRYAQHGDTLHFTPRKNDEVGVVIGTGGDVESTIDDLKANFDKLDGPVDIELAGFVELIECIESAADAGIEFGDSELPEPTEILDSNGS